MTPENKQWVLDTAVSAQAGGHTWPQFAACEAALESTFGQSLLARQDLNLFGTKQHKHHIYGTHNLPTREFEHSEWIVVNAAWITYPSLPACFDDRMATLGRLRTAYPHYNAALIATDGVTFVREVSKTWSTDPNRGQKVLDIHGLVFN